jgi:hypothetical protein
MHDGRDRRKDQGDHEVRFQTVEDRDEILKSGMEEVVFETMYRLYRLAELLSKYDV